MVRKTSDIALLLGSRGRGRPRGGGFARSVRGIWASWFGRSQWRDDRPPKHLLVPGWLAAAGVLAAFAGGYLAGGRFGTSPADGKAGLMATAPVTPVLFAENESDETEPLEANAFLVAMYPGIGDAEGRAQARQFAAWLVERDLKKARAYLVAQNDTWAVAVYYGSPAEQQATRDKLVALRDVPDQSFHEWREERRNKGEEWPRTWPTR